MKLSATLLNTGRNDQLIEFFEELTVVNLTCRIVAAGTSLLKRREDREMRLPDDPSFVKEYNNYLRIHLHVPQEHLDQIYRQANRAVRAAINDITPKESARFKRTAQRHHSHCYMCGVELNFGDHEPTPGGPEVADVRRERERRNAHRYTCEHIWPQSYGGDSIEDNFLPACVSCNSSKKMEFATWAMASVQSMIFGFAPSDNELLRIEGSYRFAIHHYAARRLAVKKNITLKKAFLHLKPWTDVHLSDAGDTGDFFNLENHQLVGFHD